MAIENINKFFEIIQNAQAIARKFDEIIEQFQGEEQTQKLVEFAQNLGFEITAEELNDLKDQAKNLNDQELDDVVAGWLNPGQRDMDLEYKEAKKILDQHLWQKRLRELKAKHDFIVE